MAKSATGACVYGLWYLLDTKHEKVLCAGGKPICTGQDTEKDLYADGYKPPKDATVKAVHVNPGTVIVQARPIENEGKVIAASPNSFYVLNDEALLNGSDIKNPLASTDQNTGQPDVTFSFTPHGGEVFEHVTKQIAERGENARLPGSASNRPSSISRSCSTNSSSPFRSSTSLKTRKASKAAAALRSPAASHQRPPKTSPRSFSRGRSR